MAKRQTKAEKQLSEEIEKAFYACASGVQINIMDLPKIKAAGVAAAGRGESVADAVREAVKLYGKAA